MAYTRTWDIAAANYNAATERSMDFIEAQAAAQWSVAANNTWKQANPWVCSGTTRVFGTLYKNNTSNPVLVIVSVDCLAAQNAIGDGTSSASIEVYNTSGTLIKEIGRVKAQEPTVPLSTVNLSAPLICVVNPTQQYKIVDLDGANGTASIAFVFEFAFDAKYTAQNWAHQEQLATAKLNTYAAGVNRIPPKDEAFAYGASTAYTTGTDLVAGDKVTMYLLNQVVSYFNIVTGTGGTKTFSLKNSGGSALNMAKVGAILGGAAELGGGSIPAILISNAGGTIDSTETGTGGTTTYRKIEFVGPSYSDVVFTNGESGVATGNKFRALDLRASKGANMGGAMTEASITLAHPTTTISSISDTWRLVAVSCILDGDLLTNSQCNISVDGTPIFSMQDTAGGNVPMELMLMFLLPAGSSATITEAGIGAVIQRVNTWGSA